MTDEAKAAFSGWVGDLVKNVGVPTAVCAVLLWGNKAQIDILSTRADRQDEFIRTTLTAEVSRGNEVLKTMSEMMSMLNQTFAKLSEEEMKSRTVLDETRRAILETLKMRQREIDQP